MNDGYTIVPNDVFSLPVKSNSKLVYIALLKFQNCERINVSISHLSEMTGMSVRTVQASITELKNAGIISVKRRKNKTSLYTLGNAECAVPDRLGNARIDTGEPQALPTINKNIKNKNKGQTERPLDRPSVDQKQLTQFTDHLKGLIS